MRGAFQRPGPARAAPPFAVGHIRGNGFLGSIGCVGRISALGKPSIQRVEFAVFLSLGNAWCELVLLVLRFTEAIVRSDAVSVSAGELRRKAEK